VRRAAEPVGADQFLVQAAVKEAQAVIEQEDCAKNGFSHR